MKIKRKNTEKLNQTIFIKDNLAVLRTLDDESVDLIYLDPPFNSNKNYGAPIGSEAAGFHFKDMWYLSDTDDVWWGELSDKYPALYEIIHAVGVINGNNDKAYLIYMAMRLLEMHRILKNTGSIYLHCDQVMNHSLKLLLDSIFGKKNFKNEIIWKRTSSNNANKNKFSVITESIFCYSKNKETCKFTRLFTDHSESYIKSHYSNKDNNGRAYQLTDLNSPSYNENTQYEYKGYKPNKNGFRWTLKKMQEMDKKGFVYFPKDKSKRLRQIRYLDEQKGTPISNLWTDIFPVNSMAKERRDYSTQKPLKLLERIIKASSNEGDIVLDPFCGCATTCVAAEILNRKWIGIDLSPLAGTLVKKRLLRQFEQGQLGKEMINPIIRDTLPIKNAPKPSKDIKHILYGKQRGFCNGCNIHFLFKMFHKDHIVPKKKGGQDTDKNLQLLCGHCNSTKGTKSMAYLKARLKEQNGGLIKEEVA